MDHLVDLGVLVAAVGRWHPVDGRQEGEVLAAELVARDQAGLGPRFAGDPYPDVVARLDVRPDHRVAELRPLVEGIVEDLLDGLAGAGAGEGAAADDLVVDGASDFAELVPMRLMSHLFGVAPQRGEDFRDWVDGIIRTGQRDLAVARAAHRAMMTHLTAALEERRARRVVGDRDDLVQMVVATKPGSTVPIKILRDRKERTLTITVDEVNAEAESSRASRDSDPNETAGFGIALDNLTPDVSRRLGAPRDIDGAIVIDIDPNGPAAQARQPLEVGDVILEVNRQPVRSAADAKRALDAVERGRSAMLLIWRQSPGGGQRIFLTIRKE